MKSKLYQCNNCDFGTKRIGLLKVHFQTTHANEKCKQTADNDNVVVDSTKPSVTITEDMAMDLETSKPVASKDTEVDLATNANVNIGTLKLKKEISSTNFKNESENFGENDTNEDFIDPMSVVKVELNTDQNVIDPKNDTEQESVKSNIEALEESITSKDSKTINNEGLMSLPPLFECKSCNNIFIDPGSLENHIKIAHEGVNISVHKGSKKYSCNYCEKSYTQSHTLKTHIKTKHCETKSQMETNTFQELVQKGQIDIIENR